MANTERVDKSLFRDEHYLGKPADDNDRIISRRIEILKSYPYFFNHELSCIEVGCGSGATITQLANGFAKTLGVDIYDYSVEFEKQKEKNRAADCEFKKLDLEHELPAEQFDRLVSFEVIEHLKTEDSIAAYYNVLKKDGMAAISVPNKWWIFETHGARLPLLPWNRVPFFSWLPSFIHERYANARIYTKKRIIRLLERHGFTVIDHCYITAPMDVLKEGWFKRKMVRYIFRGNTTKTPFLSTSVFVLAQKKSKMNDHTIKIVSIIPYKILPAKLGGEKGIALFNEYISKLVQLTGITTQNNDPSLAPGYKLLNILSNSRLRYIDLRLYFRIRQILAKEQATHLLTEHPYYGWLAWLLRNSPDLKWVVHSHNIEYMRSRSIGRWWWKALKWYEGWAYRKADRVFFISEDDMKHAQNELGVSPLKCQVVTYGIEQPAIPTTIAEKRRLVQSLHGIADDEKILLFNGALYHSTNYDALSVILEKINPILMEEKKFRYKILICGKGLPDFFNDLKDYTDKNIIYAGFVDDVSIYFQAANVFLNPILAGGGVKTKAIEALAMDCSVISTELGALGIKREMCGNKLHVVKGGEWRKFAELIISVSGSNSHTPIEFFEYYFWGNIVKNAVKSLKNNA